MGTWRRGVVVGKTCVRKRVIKKPIATTVVADNRRGRSLERKLRQLQNIVSGGGGGGSEQVADTEALFQKIVVYIFLLESRVKLLRSVYNRFGPHD